MFARSSFAAVASFRISYLSPKLPNGDSTGAELYYGISLFFSLLQMFLLGPRLVLSVREHGAKLVADSDEMTTIAFEQALVSTCDSVYYGKFAS
ncbi:hypothetical protein CY34DRAFT_17220 [Suillus luteus UH-Slu-Lm8-n1]|uniref:Uncharacterized protein n=1 Tax=Suillus luteus UH-Slu-Lm8-n1 TaxID=930992 RepID=A0A0D0AAL0_9AGAM|nr:hypothetical protein CY34DRAFT_17220 [Suillus luteus UH-Slu-Lm8-n1]